LNSSGSGPGPIASFGEDANEMLGSIEGYNFFSISMTINQLLGRALFHGFGQLIIWVFKNKS
jgi:hypothetical protein